MTIQLTSSAAEEAKKYMDKHDNDSKQYLRVGVNGGGCSGFEYNITIDQKYDGSSVWYRYYRRQEKRLVFRRYYSRLSQRLRS
jgi:Fe-S cluster assembly iron-binding protein IscA